MENLSLYQITSAFPKLIDQEEMSEEDKKEIIEFTKIKARKPL